MTHDLTWLIGIWVNFQFTKVILVMGLTRNLAICRAKGFKGTALDWLPVDPDNALYGPTREAIRNYADAFNYYYVHPVRDERTLLLKITRLRN